MLAFRSEPWSLGGLGDIIDVVVVVYRLPSEYRVVYILAVFLGTITRNSQILNPLKLVCSAPFTTSMIRLRVGPNVPV